MAKLVFLAPAQRAVEEIAQLPQNKELRGNGYRLVIAGKYICVYRLISETVFVYHIAHGASNYPVTFKRLLKKENQ